MPLWDLLLCAVLVVVWLLVVLLLAVVRGAPDASLVPGRLEPWHYLLGALVIAVYVVTAVRGVPETPGHTLARASQGAGRAGDLARVGQLLLPTLVVTVAVALVVGVTVPLPATLPGSVTASETPLDDDGATVETAPTPEATSTSAIELETPTPTPSDDPAARRLAQARMVDALLSESVTSRGDLATAIAAVGECRNLRQSLGLMTGVAQQRRAQSDQARALMVDALEDGPAMRSYLVAAFTSSGDADDAYAAWAQRSISSGCSLDANWRRGNQLSAQAQAAKREFLARWTPIASSCGLPSRTTKDI
ncbi:hypothetical protein V6V47_00670 [Micromonospora sp. CPCC 205539]|uniref:hypothetical protein n=1 Tax=Micromonospora sp. CPCC 205539 TaxID=3122408 RepID=UPI002FF37355